MACSLTAVKLQIPVVHLEAGLRSFDRTMPEEINRLVTDAISHLLFTTEESGNRNLRREGIPEGQIHLVGNTMIDSLAQCAHRLDQITFDQPLASLIGASYFLATMHRPANVDDPATLTHVLTILENASQLAPVLFVTHPRTHERLSQRREGFRFVPISAKEHKGQQRSVYLLPPMPYLEFLKLMSYSTAVLTDSGGIQEETTFLGKPCLTLRHNTERPVTVELGTNAIVGLDKANILASLRRILAESWKQASVPPLWDGRATERVLQVLRKAYSPS